MKIVKKYILVFSGLLLVFFMFSIFVSSGFASDSSYKINLGQSETNPATTSYRIGDAFEKKVAELSDGRITIDQFKGDLLGDWETQEIHVKEGSLDMCMAPASATFDPKMEFVRLPYVIFSLEGAKKVYGPGGGGKKLLNEICEKNNTYCLGVEPQGFIIVLSTKKITPLPGDPSIKKIKTRVMPAKLEEITGRTLGFSTLSMSWGEVHSALMLGTIDALMGSTYGETPMFKDIVKYQYNYNYGFSAVPWIINLDLWNSLSKKDQEILQTAMDEAMSFEWDRAAKTEEETISIMQKAGVEVIDLTKEQMMANVIALRGKVWSWVAKNFYSEEFMNTILSFAEPLVD